SVSAFILVTIGWPILIELVLSRSSFNSPPNIGWIFGLLGISPWISTFVTLQWLVWPMPLNGHRTTLWMSMGACILVVSAVDAGTGAAPGVVEVAKELEVVEVFFS